MFIILCFRLGRKNPLFIKNGTKEIVRINGDSSLPKFRLIVVLLYVIVFQYFN
jgi:hypothetical protein